MATHDLPFGLFWDTTQLENAPLFHKAPTYEVEWPYRFSHSLIIRAGKSLGIVMGRWRSGPDDIEQYLLKAVQGRNHNWITNGHVSLGEPIRD